MSDFESAYDWIKANPQRHDYMLKQDWQSLMTDPTISQIAKNEIIEMAKHEWPLSDATLWLHSHITYLQITAPNHVIKQIKIDEWHKDFLQSKWFEYLYLEFVTYDYIDDKLLRVKELNDFYATHIVFWPQPKFTYHLSHRAYSYNTVSYLGYTAFSMYNKNKIEYAAIHNYVCDIMRNCSISLIEKLTLEQCATVHELLTDVPVSEVKFHSINEIKRIHDLHAAEVVRSLMTTDSGKVFKYDPRLIDIAKSAGFFMPVSNKAMIARGQQHSNCVANYADKQKMFIMPNDCVVNSCSRLFFTATATLELSIEYTNQCIVSTHCIQYKGKFNKNVFDINTVPNINLFTALTLLRVSLVGEPPTILQVMEVENAEKS